MMKPRRIGTEYIFYQRNAFVAYRVVSLLVKHVMSLHKGLQGMRGYIKDHFLALPKAFIPIGTIDKAIRDLAVGGMQVTRQQLEQYGFTAAIRPRNDPMFVRRYNPGEILVEYSGSFYDCDIIDSDHGLKLGNYGYSQTLPAS